MPSLDIYLSSSHQAVIDRFVAACHADSRIVAAFLFGSYAAGEADIHSDLDLYLITEDEAYDEFLAGREAFVALLGDTLFLEDFGIANCKFFVLSDGTEGELWIGSESNFKDFHCGPICVLVDKQELLAGVILPHHQAEEIEQVENLRRQIMWFWHEFSHFVKAMGRDQLWFAYGSLEIMRGMCVNLARLQFNFRDGNVGEEPYFKIESDMPIEQLDPLLETFCPMEREAMHRAALLIVGFYQETTRHLAREHGVVYPGLLERLMVVQLEAVSRDQ